MAALVLKERRYKKTAVEVTELEITIPRAYDPTWSKLGESLRGHEDARVATARFYFWAVVLLVVIVLLGIFTWAILHNEIIADPRGSVATGFWLFQLVLAGAYVVFCGIGFRPSTLVRLTDRHLHISHGGRRLAFAVEDVRGSEIVTALDVHRHYSRYRQAHIFIGPRLDDYLLLRIGDGVIVLGVDDRWRGALTERLSVAHRELCDERIVRVAL